MAEYVNKKALVKELEIMAVNAPKTKTRTYARIISAIELYGRDNPAELVTIVRCVHCKHYRTYMGRDMCAKNAQMLEGHEVGLCATGKYDFCSSGEAKVKVE